MIYLIISQEHEESFLRTLTLLFDTFSFDWLNSSRLKRIADLDY